MTVTNPAPEYITEAKTVVDTTQTLIASLPSTDFAKPQQKDLLAQKFATVEAKINAGDLQGALHLLKNDIIPFIQVNVTTGQTSFTLQEKTYEIIVLLEHKGISLIEISPASVTLDVGTSLDFQTTCFFGDGSHVVIG